jgi:hypothetical protein
MSSAEQITAKLIEQDLRTVTLEGGGLLGKIGRFDHAYAEQTFDGQMHFGALHGFPLGRAAECGLECAWPKWPAARLPMTRPTGF